jgi:hypothetical protein
VKIDSIYILLWKLSYKDHDPVLQDNNHCASSFNSNIVRSIFSNITTVNYLTFNSIERSPSWEDTSCWDIKDVSLLLRSTKVRCFVKLCPEKNESSTRFHIQFFKIHANILILSTNRSSSGVSIRYPSLFLSLYASRALWALAAFQFLNLYTVGRTPWTRDQPVTRPLHTHRRTRTQNKRTQISMPRVVFEPSILVFEGAKTVHALDHATIVIGFQFSIWD